MDNIISLIEKYPHLVVYLFLSIIFAVTYSYYGRKAYYNKKYYKRFRIVHIITAIILFIMIIYAACAIWIF
jgi:uncharacterized membrane protein